MRHLSWHLHLRTDANNHTTTYAYDADGRRTSTTSPIGQIWSSSYDAAGNVVQTVDANGNATETAGDGTTTTTYDRAGQLTGIDYSDSTPDVTFAYDAAGNRTSMTDGAGTETRAYDDANRLTQVTRGTDTFAYVYDLAGNLTRRTYPDATVTDYGFDDDSRMATVTSGGSATSYGYDGAGNLTTTVLPVANGHVETRTYDRAGRLTQIGSAKAGATLVDSAYMLDAVGNPTQIVRTGSAPGTTTYSYDDRDRLTEACYATSCAGATDYIRWTYDGVGNRLTESRPAGTISYTYNTADQLTLAGSTTYGYDVNGNQISAGSKTFGYDLANRLSSTTSGSTTTNYLYDGDSQRIESSTGTAPSEKTKHLWEENGSLSQIAIERDGNNTPIRRYVYGARRISMTAAGADHYYAYDALGSVADMTSASGTGEWSYAYEPFGVSRTETQNDPAAPTNDMKFAGELLDPTGLYHLRARQYDPQLGKFQRTDPVEPSTEQPYGSAYAYAANRPTVMVDPSGETFVPSNAAVVAATGVTSPAGVGDRVLMLSATSRRSAAPSSFCWGCIPGAIRDGIEEAPAFIWHGEIRGVIDNPDQAAMAVLMLVQPELVVVRTAMVLIQTERGFKVLQLIANSRYGSRIANRMIAWSKTPSGERLIGEPAFGAPRTGSLNTGRVRAGIGRDGGPVFRVATDNRKVDFRR